MNYPNESKTILSIIIVSYFNFDYIPKLIQSIITFNDLKESTEIIIIDNSKELRLKNYVNSLNLNYIHYYESENNGYGKSNNYGESLSKGKYLMFLNPDTYFINPFLKSKISLMELNGISVIGFKLVDKNFSRRLSFYFFSPFFISNILIKLFNSINLFLSKYMFLSGAAFIILKDSFSIVGKFDENIFLYNEEIDLFLRLKKSKQRVYFDKKVKIVHLEGNFIGEKIYNFKERYKSLKYVCIKHNLDFKNYVIRELRSTELKLFLYKIVL